MKNDYLNIERGYHEGMIKSNHDLTVNGVEVLKKLQAMRSELDDIIRHLEPLLNHSKKFPHNE